MIVKVCEIHGELTASQCNIEKRHDDKNKVYYRCHECKITKNRRYYAKNREDILARAKISNLPPKSLEKYKTRVEKYKQTDKFKAYKKEYRSKNLELLRQKARDKHKKVYNSIKEKVQARRRELRNLNKDEINACRRVQYVPRLAVPRRKVALHPREYQRLYSAKNKARQQYYIKELVDHYVKQQLQLGSSFKLKDIPFELIELKRTLIKIKRVLKNEDK